MWRLLNEATIDLVLLAAIVQFEDQTNSRLLIAALEEYEDQGTTQKEDAKKTPAEMLYHQLYVNIVCVLYAFLL